MTPTFAATYLQVLLSMLIPIISDKCPLPTHQFIVLVTEVDDTLVAAVQLLLRGQRDVVPEEVPELRGVT